MPQSSAYEFTRELMCNSTPVMDRYLTHFKADADKFISGLIRAAEIRDSYSTSESLGDTQCAEGLAWSKVYFLYAINCALISTRLFLSGYLVASGNQARQAVESIAFGILLPFPNTGAYRQLKAGHDIEHKALEWLVRNAAHCGTATSKVEKLRKQAKFFDMYSHPSRLALASTWGNNLDHGFTLGAAYIPGYLPQYRKEMTNRVSLTHLISGSIAGTLRELTREKLVKA